MVRNWKAAVLLAGLVLAFGAGSAPAQAEDFPNYNQSVREVVVGAGKDYTVDPTNGGDYWTGNDPSTATNIRISGGTLTVGKSDQVTGTGFEFGTLAMDSGVLNIVAPGTASRWQNGDTFMTVGWNGATPGADITGGTVNISQNGIFFAAWGDATSNVLHFGGNSIVNLNGTAGVEAVIRAGDWDNRPKDAADVLKPGTDKDGNPINVRGEDGKDEMWASVRIDGGAQINVAHGAILSRETHMNGGTISVASGGKLLVAGAVRSVVAGDTYDPNSVLDGIGDARDKWGRFTMSGGTIDNKGVIDFATGDMTLNASGGELTGNLKLAATAGSANGNTYATNLHVLKGGTFKIGGNLDIAASGATFENLGTLTIGGTTNAAGALTLAGGSSTTFTGAVTATGGMNVGDGTTAASATFGDNLTGAVNVKDGSSMTVNGTIANATDVTLGKNSTLNIAEAGGLTASGTLDVQKTTKLKVAVNATDIEKHGTLDAAKVTLNGSDADKDAINAYLQTQNVGSLISNTTFSVDENGKLVFAVTKQENSAQGMETALDKAGIGEMAGGMSASASSALASILTDNAGAYADGLLSAEGKTVYKLMDAVFLNASLTTEESRSVVNTLAGYDSAKSLDIAMVTTTNVNARVNARVANNNLARANADSQFGSGSALASYALNSSFANRFWAGGFGLWEDADKRGFDNGYKYRSGGVIAGYDRVFGAVTAGGSFAYTGGSYEDKNSLASDSTIESYAFTLYGTYNHCSGFFATLMGGYTYSDYNMNNLLTRAGQWDKSEFHANTWTIGGTIGHDFHPTQCLTITPTIGLYHYTSSTNTFRTSVRNNMKVEQDSTELPIDVAVNYDIPTATGKVRLSANTGYSYNFSKDGGSMDGFGYNGIAGSRIDGIKGRENARGTWNLGAGATWYAGRFDVGVKYDYYAKSDYDAHRLMGTVGISF